ncbi:hypothetical protein ACFC0D_25455 [Streptomyces sp. NPDC056222]|uniref:hypothetical protein n=1 Tax=Streptomyces sp. NPDC056222 TaxID=3345749 RepID=UPI0035E0F131
MSTAPKSMASIGEFVRRSDFINVVIDDFAKENNLAGSPALNAIATFIEERVLAPEREWNADPARTEGGLSVAREALTQCLNTINQIAPIDKIERDDVRPITEGVFLAVTKYTWNCPFPLFFC